MAELNYPQVIVTRPQWCYINFGLGKGLELSGDIDPKLICVLISVNPAY